MRQGSCESSTCSVAARKALKSSSSSGCRCAAQAVAMINCSTGERLFRECGPAHRRRRRCCVASAIAKDWPLMRVFGSIPDARRQTRPQYTSGQAVLGLESHLVVNTTSRLQKKEWWCWFPPRARHVRARRHVRAWHVRPRPRAAWGRAPMASFTRRIAGWPHTTYSTTVHATEGAREGRVRPRACEAVGMREAPRRGHAPGTRRPQGDSLGAAARRGGAARGGGARGGRVRPVARRGGYCSGLRRRAA